MSITRRLTQEQSIGKLLHRLPGVEKVFNAVHIHRPGDREYNLWATMPYINATAWKNTLNAYKLKVMAYNKQANTENATIKKQIAAVKKWTDAQPQDKQANISLLQAGFENNNAHLPVWEYNKKVEAYNTMYGSVIIHKKKIPTIKQSSQQIFEAFLWEYNNQLRKLRDLRSSNGKSWYTSVPKMEVNTKHLENAVGEHGVPLLSCCPDTILNHKNRLIEAGILINSEYRGSERGTLHHISDEILMVFDDFDQKLVYTENQLLTISQPEVFRDTVIPTRAINKPIIKTGVDKSTPLDTDKDLRPLDHAHPTDDSTRAPMSKMQNPQMANRAQKNYSAENSIKTRVSAGTDNKTGDGPSVAIENVMENPTNFAKNLSKMETPSLDAVTMDQLTLESNAGTMARDDFRVLLLQLLFSKFAKIYKNHPHFDVIFAGVWLKTYQVWLHSKMFRNKNGELLHKNTMLVHYRELLYCLENKQWGVIAWINKGTFVPSNPFIYLNPENPTKGTFAHHFLNVREKSPKAFNKIREVVKIAENQGKKAQDYQKYLSRLNRKLAQLFNGKISDTDLLRYVRDNMPQAIQQNFQKHFDNYRNNRLKSNYGLTGIN
jgi:hypothetical protein